MQWRDNKRPGSTPEGLFRNDTTDLMGTLETADLFNQVIEETEALIQSVGLIPSATDNTQILQSITKLIDTNTIDLKNDIDNLKTKTTNTQLEINELKADYLVFIEHVNTQLENIENEILNADTVPVGASFVECIGIGKTPQELYPSYTWSSPITVIPGSVQIWTRLS